MDKAKDHRFQKLTDSEFKQLLEVTRNIFAFARFIFVVHPIRGKVRFELYPYQKSVLWSFIKNRFNIILKFRQAGITELISMYSLWLAMYHPSKNVQIISIKDRVAKKVLRKIKYMYKNLPDHLKVSIVNGRPGEHGTATEMEFANGSMISSVPTTEDAGRSEAVTLLVIDEAAIVRWASTIWKAAFPTLSTGGSAIVNSCITGDTEIIGKTGSFRVDMIAPREFGKHDVSALGLEVITHKGRWKKIIGAVNKGELTTWEVVNCKGESLKATPAHKLLTPLGWRTIKQIIEKNLDVVFYDTKESVIENPPLTIPPREEVFKDIKGFPKYKVSNLGIVYCKIKGSWVPKKPIVGHKGHLRVSLYSKDVKAKFQLSHLIARAFIGEIPESYVVDHINCIPSDNYVTNLQIITKKENATRAARYSKSLNLAVRIKSVGTDYQLIGYILKHKNTSLTKLVKCIKKRFDKDVNYSYINRIQNGKRNTSTYISKLILKREFRETIYDICVEDDESYLTSNSYINHNTPYGVGNWFHNSWVDAISGGNSFTPIRLFWTMHPERDQIWYDEMRDALGPRGCAQEIDGDFLSSGFSVFDLTDIKAIEDTLFDFIPIETRFDHNLRVFDKVKRNMRYFLGADVSTGRSRDYSAFTLMQKDGEEAAVYKGKMPVSKYANLMMTMGRKYNNAVLAPETNDIGLAITSKIQDAGYPNLHYSEVILRKKKDRNRKKTEEVPGWLTTSKNRPIIIDELEEDVRNDNVLVKDPFFVQEAYTFIYNERNKPIAMGKEKRSSESEQEDSITYTDDAILGKAITNFVRKGKTKSAVVAPR